MDQNEAVVAVLSTLTGCFTLLGIVWMWFRGRKNVGAQALNGLENRLARVEVALDDVTAELTRATESQQLLVKALTDRQALPLR
jgi:hypothetical protein